MNENLLFAVTYNCSTRLMWPKEEQEGEPNGMAWIMKPSPLSKPVRDAPSCQNYIVSYQYVIMTIIQRLLSGCPCLHEPLVAGPT